MPCHHEQLKTVYISARHRGRLKALVEHVKPKPKLGGMVEYLIDEALRARGISPETLEPITREDIANAS